MSLVELIVAIAIFTTIMSGVVLLFSTVTNTVRRSYQTMALFEQTNNAVLAIERDVQTLFNNPNSGTEVRFYGEPFGFVIVGIDEYNKVSRITYAVHRDTARIDEPQAVTGRGETITLPRRWDQLQALSTTDLSAFYYRAPGQDWVDVEVEVIYGVLLRFVETDVAGLQNFPKMNALLASGATPRLPRPSAFSDESGVGSPARFPWLTSYLWTGTVAASVPPHARDAFKTAETCHYWLQLLNGPGLPGAAAWDATDIWWREKQGALLLDQFWYDDHLPVPPYPDTQRFHLQQHVVAENFLLNAFLLDPQTGVRIKNRDDTFVDILGPAQEPIFRYAVEEYGQRNSYFNTLFNLTGKDTDGVGFMEKTMTTLDPRYLLALLNDRDFYELGNPAQGRVPVSLDVAMWSLNESASTGGAVVLNRFARTIYLPAGYMRPRQVKQ
ncbi:MAG TPA: hypothetical protein PLQ42_01305 [Candidatus Hydrogenedentes bacterium]|jgi:type II secretory pathway pseudopilin PulG|nr:MAG: hypothetical protein BWY07_01452 [Candidatus Hydrogenedentes bacterium ADurb.Bin170]HNZ49521.1 hypothetical protein [Candidatus Hydrogenedentota bacterium]HOR49696.1 hypothetical protein [Candidatus Hydrogenedentota bacterium]